MGSGRRVPWLVPCLVPLLALAAGPFAPPSRAQDAAGKGADAAKLRAEMEEAYREVEKDFEAMRGAKSKETLAALVRTAIPALRDGGWDSAAASWEKERLLGPIVAGRLGRSAAAAPAAPPPEDQAVSAQLAAGAEAVFPEKTMLENWEKHFLDLDVVTRWRAASGLPPAGGGGAKGGAGTPPAPATAPQPPAPDPADMVHVPRGDLVVTVHRGWPNPADKPGKRALRSYYMDRTEVTCAAYGAFLRGLKDAKLRDRVTPADWAREKGTGLPLVPEGRGSLPVTGATYEGAVAFAQALGKRLPTEDEWERAARGNDNLLYPWGAEWAAGSANLGGAAKGPSAVGSFEKDRSPFGAMDMAGNVAEFVATLEDGKPVKGIPKDTDRVVRRGGNFRSPPEEAAGDYRYVVGANQVARQEGLGFRCAMDEDDYRKKYGPK